LVGPLQSEIESGSVIWLRLGPDRASVLLNDPLHGGQSDSGSFKLRFRMETLKYAEQFLCILQIEAGAVIAHEEDRRFPRLLDAVDFDYGAGSATGVLQSVA
jgi:hypothetical protein